MNSEHIYTQDLTVSYPATLTINDNWSLIKLEWSEARQKFDKTPIDIFSGLAANSDEMSVSFQQAFEHLGRNRVLNYRHRDGSKRRLGLIDCDHCVRPDGSVSPRVRRLLKYMDAYAQFSVSDGIHILCWLDEVPPDGHKDREWDLEFYWSSRSIAMTGKRVVLPDWSSPDDVLTGTEKFLKLHKARFRQAWLPPAPAQSLCRSNSLSRDEVLSKLFGEAAGRKWADIYAGNWQAHYPSPSEADLALLMKFAFYTGKDRNLMESMYLESPLSRILLRGTVDEPTKWRTKKWANQNYRNKTLDEAIDRTSSVYTPCTKAVSDLEIFNIARRKLA